jgi:hypothetical protein
MSKFPATTRAERDYIKKCANKTEARMLGEVRRAKGYKTGVPRPIWDGAKFKRGLEAINPDYPSAAAAELYAQAIAQAHGNPSRFRSQIDELLR